MGHKAESWHALSRKQYCWKHNIQMSATVPLHVLITGASYHVKNMKDLCHFLHFGKIIIWLFFGRFPCKNGGKGIIHNPLQPSKHEKMTFFSCVFCVFPLYFIGTILSKKCGHNWVVQRKDKKGGWLYKGNCLQKKSSNLPHTMHLNISLSLVTFGNWN